MSSRMLILSFSVEFFVPHVSVYLNTWAYLTGYQLGSIDHFEEIDSNFFFLMMSIKKNKKNLVHIPYCNSY